jgi:small nuclear ribonucleoprotein (snRNP)-like protein
MQAVAKSIVDITELVSLLQRGLGQGTTWERQLAGHLVDVDRQLNLLRLTVAMERQDSEILEAAQSLAAACRLAAAVLGGSRADPTTRAAVKLVVDLANSVCRDLLKVQELRSQR